MHTKTILPNRFSCTAKQGLVLPLFQGQTEQSFSLQGALEGPWPLAPSAAFIAGELWGVRCRRCQSARSQPISWPYLCKLNLGCRQRLCSVFYVTSADLGDACSCIMALQMAQNSFKISNLHNLELM